MPTWKSSTTVWYDQTCSVSKEKWYVWFCYVVFHIKIRCGGTWIWGESDLVVGVLDI